VNVETRGGQHVFEVEVHFADLDPDSVRVELYANGVAGGEPLRHEMQRGRQAVGAPSGWVFTTSVSTDRPAEDFTARVVPHRDGVTVPLENARITWQR
jgi:starch phosphorylase